MKTFASDNFASVHPLILKALNDCNDEHEFAYGYDKYTEIATNKFKELFGEQIDVYFVFNGTGANVLSISTLLKSFNSVICASSAHINVDECGAFENFSGAKLNLVETIDGKIKKEDIKKYLHAIGVEHHSQPKVVTISQPTELGTLYTIDELKDLSDFIHNNNMFLHIDGARIANSVVALNTTLKEMITNTNVDVLSFGGTKNGMMFGEAVIFFNKNLSGDFKFLRKHGLQLYSKMRYISAQFIEYLSNELWLKNAKLSNDFAKYLEKKIKNINGIELIQKVETNGLFVKIPKNKIEILQQKYYFYVWDEELSIVRFMTSFDTTKEDIDNFVKYLEENII